MAAKPRILLVGPLPPTKGGVTTFMLNLMASFLRQDFEFIGFTTSRPAKKNTLDNYGYAAMLRGGVGRIFAGAAITAWHVLKFPFVVVGRRIDLVQVQASDYQAFWESALYVLWARLLRRPVIIRIGGAFDVFFAASPPFVRGMIGAVLRRPQCVIAQSEMSREFLAQAGRTHDILVLPNWPKDGILPRTASVADSNICLFVVGSDARRKGIEEVIVAMQTLDRSGDPIRFHLLAVPPVLQDRIRALNLSNIAAMEGFVPQSRVLEVMRGAAIFLHPSHAEGFPNSLIEAMACSLPSVLTKVGAVPEIISAGGARAVPVGDGEALAREVALLSASPPERARLSAEARENLQRRYTAEKVLPGLATVYARLLQRRSGGASA